MKFNKGKFRIASRQDVQIECKRFSCIYNQKGGCSNESPALTINVDSLVNSICWTMKERHESRIIDLDNDKNEDTYSELLIKPNENVIKVSLLFSAMVGDEIWCDNVEYRVLEILDELPDWKRAGFTYQKILLGKV